MPAKVGSRNTPDIMVFEALFRWVPRNLIDGADALDTVIDRFDATHSAIVGRFNSRFGTPAAEAVDAFSQFWGDDFNYVFGNFNKTDATMDHIERDDAEAGVIVPEHTSKPLWCSIWSAA